jgi:hypothetical protein
MSDSRPPSGTAPSTRPTWIVVGLLLAVGVIVPLMVWLYDTESPALGGFPFFYWFQFLLIPIVSGLTFLAFKLSENATARDRAARRSSGTNGGGSR